MARSKPARLYTVAELVDHPLLAPFNLTEKSIRRAVQAGRLVGYRLTGGPLHFDDQQVQAWIAASRTDAERDTVGRSE